MIKKQFYCRIALWTVIISLLTGGFYTCPVFADNNGQTVSVNMLKSAAVVAIRDRAGVPEDSDSLMLSLLNYPSAVTVPDGVLTLTVDLPYGVRYNAPTTANVKVSVDGTIVAVVTLKFQVKLYQQVVVAAQPIASGEVLSTQNLTLNRMDVGRLNSGYYTDVNKLAGLICSRMIPAGTAINQYMVDKPIVIKRGSAVTIIARSGGVEITAAGQALQDGYEGQIIRVQNVNSRKIMGAKVLNDSAVEVIVYKP